jgi:hypothetical protein
VPRPHATSPKPAAPAHSARAWPRPEGTGRPAAAGPCCRHHEPSRHCRPGGACVPIRAAGARPFTCQSPSELATL